MWPPGRTGAGLCPNHPVRGRSQGKRNVACSAHLWAQDGGGGGEEVGERADEEPAELEEPAKGCGGAAGIGWGSHGGGWGQSAPQNDSMEGQHARVHSQRTGAGGWRPTARDDGGGVLARPVRAAPPACVTRPHHHPHAAPPKTYPGARRLEVVPSSGTILQRRNMSTMCQLQVASAPVCASGGASWGES